MKSILGILLLCLTACQAKQKAKTKEVLIVSGQLDSSNTKQDSLFVIEVNMSDNDVRIMSPKNSDFELPDSSSKTEVFKRGDFNADGKEDILLNMGACGTGGCMYGLFLLHKDNYYKLAYWDYLKNVEFKIEKNGLWTIQSSEEIEPYNPSKIQITTFKFEKKTNEYVQDTSYLYYDKETKEKMNEMKKSNR